MTNTSGLESIIALIPARAHSKRVPRKNFRPLAGRTLVERAVDAARASGIFSRVIVSTDEPEFFSRSPLGDEVTVRRRSAGASSDTASSLDVIREVSAQEGLGQAILVLLQPTSPFRRPDDIRAAWAMYRGGPYDAVVSVAPADATVAFAMEVEDGAARFLYPQALTKRTQELNLFTLNGAIYISSLADIERYGGFFGGRVGAYVMDRALSLDIDTEEDWQAAERRLAERGRQ